MLEYILSLFISLLIRPFYFLINIVLYPLVWCSFSYIKHIRQVWNLCSGLRDDLVLWSDGSSVFIVDYDEDGDEIRYPLYTGVIVWDRGYKLNETVELAAKRQFIFRSIAFLLVVFIYSLLILYLIYKTILSAGILSKVLMALLVIFLVWIMFEFQREPFIYQSRLANLFRRRN